MAHMGGQDTAAAHVLRGDPPEEIDAYRASLASEDAFTVDGLNTFLVNNRSALPFREVLTTWGLAAQATLDYAAALPDDEWRDRRVPVAPGSNRRPIPRAIAHRGMVGPWRGRPSDHGLGPQPQHWPIFLTIDMGVRMLPWTLGEAGIDLQGASVQIDVEGAGEGSWHWGLGTAEAPPPDKKPDTFIQGRAPQFALVAAHRIPVDDALDSGNVVSEATRTSPRPSLRHIRAYSIPPLASPSGSRS